MSNDRAAELCDFVARWANGTDDHPDAPEVAAKLTTHRGGYFKVYRQTLVMA